MNRAYCKTGDLLRLVMRTLSAKPARKDAVLFGSTQKARSCLGHFGFRSRLLKCPPARFSNRASLAHSHQEHDKEKTSFAEMGAKQRGTKSIVTRYVPLCFIPQNYKKEKESLLRH